MQHPLRQARQAAQTGTLVQIAHQWGETAGAQQRHAFGRRRQGQQAHTRLVWCPQLPGRTQAHITATDDEHTGAAEAGGQGAKRGLV